MHLLTLEEQFVRELQEVLEVERQLIKKIPSIYTSLEGLPIEFLRGYLAKKCDQVESLEEILRSINRDSAGAPPHDSSFSLEMDSLIQDGGANDSATIGAIEEIADLLRLQYKKLADHARILGLPDAEDLLDAAHVSEANTSIALTRFEFHHAAAEFETFSSVSR
jgi:ferritin-like metal-binding protein YciE